MRDAALAIDLGSPASQKAASGTDVRTSCQCILSKAHGKETAGVSVIVTRKVRKLRTVTFDSSPAAERQRKLSRERKGRMRKRERERGREKKMDRKIPSDFLEFTSCTATFRFWL